MDPEITIKLPLSQVNVLLMALSKQPLEGVLDTFLSVRSQAAAQMPPPKATEE